MAPSSKGYSEDELIEQPAIALFGELGWDTANCFEEKLSLDGTLGRQTRTDVVLVRRLRRVLEEINPGVGAEAIELAIAELTRARSAVSPVEANREIYRLLKDGVKVSVRDAAGHEVVETIQVIDWSVPSRNDFFLASQLWVTGEMYTRRADLVGFVNGIPLVFVELKAAHAALKTAYDENLRDYKTAIPQLFWFNGLIILSNGSESRVGSVTATWEHFSEWKRINSEGDMGIVSLETMIRGTCEPTHLLDLVENFTLYDAGRGELVKLLGKNHQYLGVNSALEGLRSLDSNRGRLGVFWHTQGSGKSVSMIFFAQKVLRKVPGHWTFVIVTDRDELDEQIYKNFANVGAVTEQQAQANSAADLRQLLREDHRYVFTLIQKFRTEKGQHHPVLSERADIIVMTDEAHRSQYDTFAHNMRIALPNAAFIGFTGTPLMAGEERTRDVFGNYVSVYSFKRSIEDRATVPLYYENRIPELQLTNEDLNDQMEQLLEDAALDEDQERKLEREFGRQYHLVTREDRLETIAADLVGHFMGRGQRGKAMVVCIDKATAVRMYDKVQKYWQIHLARLRAMLAMIADEDRSRLTDQIAYMEQLDMAVVVSQSQNEVADLAAKGVDIVPHRRRMVTEDLAQKFKNEDDPLAMVFVCAMWMTGFDVPSCSTIYLDKPMRNHTLMQTIARANRVFKDKVNGLIVDYVGVFRDLQRALAIYSPALSGEAGGETPVQDKTALVDALREAIGEAAAYCAARGVIPTTIMAAPGLARVRLLDDAVEAIVVNDDSKREYLLLADRVLRLYRAVLPDPSAQSFLPTCTLMGVIAQKIRSLATPPDISAVMQAVEDLLDDSVAAEGYVIRETSGVYGTNRIVDLGQIDFEALRARFADAHPRSEAEKLRALISGKLMSMVRLNKSRLNYLEKFQRMIDEYNAGSLNLQAFFDQLVHFIRELDEEDKRALAEQLSEEELAIFDLLTKPDPALTEAEEQTAKKVAQDLLAALKKEKLVLDWRRRQATRAAVRQAIEIALDQLPDVYTREIYQRKCDLTYEHVYESYFDDGSSIYSSAA